MSEKGVDANYRFIASYIEVNTRIIQRHQALTLYVRLTASLLATLLVIPRWNYRSQEEGSPA